MFESTSYTCDMKKIASALFGLGCRVGVWWGGAACNLSGVVWVCVVLCPACYNALLHCHLLCIADVINVTITLKRHSGGICVSNLIFDFSVLTPECLNPLIHVGLHPTKRYEPTCAQRAIYSIVLSLSDSVATTQGSLTCGRTSDAKRAKATDAAAKPLKALPANEPNN